MDLMVNGFIMVSTTMNMPRRHLLHRRHLEANNVAISRRQRMLRSHSHLPPPHPCTIFAEMPSETTNICFSREQPLSHPLNIPTTDVSQPVTGSGLNDDIENSQSDLNNALLSTLILARVQCNQLDTKHSYVITSIHVRINAYIIHCPYIIQHSVTTRCKHLPRSFCDPSNMRQTACGGDTHWEFDCKEPISFSSLLVFSIDEKWILPGLTSSYLPI